MGMGDIGQNVLVTWQHEALYVHVCSSSKPSWLQHGLLAQTCDKQPDEAKLRTVDVHALLSNLIASDLLWQFLEVPGLTASSCWHGSAFTYFELLHFKGRHASAIGPVIVAKSRHREGDASSILP